MENQNKKPYGLRLDNDVIECIKHYADAENITESAFITNAIKAYCAQIRHQRSGGLYMTVPNPQAFQATAEQKAAALEILTSTAHKLALNNGCLTFGVSELAAYAADRLYRDNNELKAIFKVNFEIDKNF